MFRTDLHTHSEASPDGSLTMDQYRRALHNKRLDYIAITDHNTIDFALQARATLGSAIIVGEEIKSSEGEIVGLYLTKPVASGLSGQTTISHIHDQGGLVYIPHPLERSRHSVSSTILDTLKSQIDIIEVYNGRGRGHGKDRLIAEWADKNGISKAASSDAHGYQGWGHTYSLLASTPTSRTLVQLLHTAQYSFRSVGVRGMAYPSLNRIRRRK